MFSSNMIVNFKEQLMLHHRKMNWPQPEYKLIKSSGPDHAKKYTMGVFFRGKEISNATASSKKKAEMKAAMKVYRQLNPKTLPLDA